MESPLTVPLKEKPNGCSTGIGERIACTLPATCPTAFAWLGLLESGAWLTNAEHANAMARYLSEGLQALPGVSLMFPTQANSVFVELPPHAIEALKAKGWTFYTFIGAGGARFVCAWNTTVELLDQLLADVKAVLDVRA